ncbi:MAG TPA: class I SAM-dependent methyltransferase [bacterium]|nr:class I SAM-dependent methyltransferase [bacterium]HPP08872.1 class I SAM-dependent methyltransferase [bacterium]
MKRFVKGFYRWLTLFPHYVFAGYSKTRSLKEIKRIMDDYDMVKAPSEDYFKQRYLAIINEVLRRNFTHNISLKILDAGCGQGRITIELAKMGHKIDAIDVVKSALEKGKKYAEQQNVHNLINWQQGKLPECLSQYMDNGYDLVLCLEVLYMMSWSESKKTLEELARKVKNNGVIMISVRPRFYYLAYSLMRNDFKKFRWCATHNDFLGLGEHLCWADVNQMTKLLEQLGFRDLGMKGIRIFSGIEGDPTSFLAIPHLLSTEERRILSDVEDSYSNFYTDHCRYTVFWGTRL